MIIEKLIVGQLRQQSSTDLMKHLVQDLLDYAQIKAGKFRRNLKKFNIKTAVDEIIQIQIKQAESKGIELFAQYEGANGQEGLDSPIVYHDRERIMQIILNL
jgi:signal transduction histidine kinase